MTLNADGSGNDISMQSNAAEKLKLTAEGNLHLQGSDSRIQLNAQGGANVVGNNTVHIRGDGAHMKLMTASGGNYIFEVNGTEELRVQSGGGISFNGDTAAANALNDAEYGTWTPAIAGTTGNHTISGTCNYTKIGRLVTVNAYIYNGNNIANTAAEWNFTGLPYPPIRDAVCAVRFHNVNVPSDVSWCIVQVQTGTNGVEVWGNRDNSSIDILQWSDIGTGHVEFTCTYQATS